MATNYVEPGNILEFTAPAGGVVSGTPVLIGGTLVVPIVTAAATVRFNGALCGVFTLPKQTTQVWSEGQALFWDAANGKATTDATLGLPIGSVTAAALSADTTGTVRLNGPSVAGRSGTIRKRFTVAQVNAGATLLPAVAGLSYRIHDAAAIAVGGAATSVTTIDLIGTLATARKIVAFGQAAMTQSALVRAGSAGGVILADGASFTPNDAGTAITVGITGSAITVATNVDFLVTYSVE